MEKTLAALLDEIDELCVVYIGKNAPSEEWVKTCRRLERIDTLRRKLHRERQRAQLTKG